MARSVDRPCTKKRLSRNDCANASTPSAVLWPFCDPACGGKALAISVMVILVSRSGGQGAPGERGDLTIPPGSPECGAE